MKNKISFLIFTVLIIFIISGCSTDSVVTVKQEAKDKELATALNQIFNDVFSNVKLTASKENNIDDTIKSPVSGNVKVTGWITVDEQAGRTSWVLDFAFTDYKTSQSTLTYLIFNGNMNYSGYTNEYTCIYTMKSSALRAKGKIESLDIDYTCEYNLTVTLNKYTGKSNITGKICSRDINLNF